MLSRSLHFAALALIFSLVVATGSTLIAQAAQPAPCVMAPHDCHQTTKVTPSCCHAGDGSQQGPIESRVQLTVNLSHHPIELAAGTVARTSARLEFHTSSASISLPDLATRFAPLLV